MTQLTDSELITKANARLFSAPGNKVTVDEVLEVVRDIIHSKANLNMLQILPFTAVNIDCGGPGSVYTVDQVIDCGGP